MKPNKTEARVRAHHTAQTVDQRRAKILISLRAGYGFTKPDNWGISRHIGIFDSWTAALNTLHQFTEPCACPDCCHTLNRQLQAD